MDGFAGATGCGGGGGIIKPSSRGGWVGTRESMYYLFCLSSCIESQFPREVLSRVCRSRCCWQYGRAGNALLAWVLVVERRGWGCRLLVGGKEEGSSGSLVINCSVAFRTDGPSGRSVLSSKPHSACAASPPQANDTSTARGYGSNKWGRSAWAYGATLVSTLRLCRYSPPETIVKRLSPGLIVFPIHSHESQVPFRKLPMLCLL